MNPTRSTGCTCGGTITAEMGLEGEAIAEHQTTDLHREWRERGGMDIEPGHVASVVDAFRSTLAAQIVVNSRRL